MTNKVKFSLLGAEDEGHIFGLENYNFALWEDVNSETSDGIVMVTSRYQESRWGYLLDLASFYESEHSEFGEQVAQFLCTTLKYDRMIEFGRVANKEKYRNILQRIRDQQEGEEYSMTLKLCEYQDSPSYGKCQLISEWDELENSAVHLSCTCREPRYRSTTKGSCEQCPEGSGTDRDGMDMCICSAGKFWRDELCYTCPIDSYSDQGATECIPCPENSTAQAGSSRCQCQAGRYFQEGTCLLCPDKRYSNSQTTYCKLCPGGLESVPDRTFCSCPTGQFWDFSQSDCIPCLENTYSKGNTTSCLNCPERSTAQPGSTSCTCPAGYYMTQTGDSPVCAACPENHFSSVGSTGCTPCPVSQVSGPGSEGCVRCELGEHWENHTCHACPEGYHGDGVHCFLCPEGYTAVQGLCASAELKSNWNYKDAAIIGLVILAVLLTAGVTCTVVMKGRRLVKNSRSGGNDTDSGAEQADNIEMKAIESKDQQKEEITVEKVVPVQLF